MNEPTNKKKNNTTNWTLLLTREHENNEKSTKSFEREESKEKQTMKHELFW
jgi:hypothetical protein